MFTRHALISALLDHIETLAETLLGTPSSRTQLEWRWGRKGSMSLAIRGAKAGKWYDHEAGKGGGLLKLIQHVNGTDAPSARSWAQSWLGGPTAAPVRHRSEHLRNLNDDEIRRAKKNSDKAESIWNSASHITEQGTAYLATRGLPANWSASSIREIS